MKIKINIFFAIIAILGLTYFLLIKPDRSESKKSAIYAEALMHCKAGGADGEVEAAMKRLDDKNKQVVIELLDCLTLTEYADPRYFEMPAVDVDSKTGERTIHQTTLGELAFNTIRRKIEGFKPWDYPETIILDQINIRQWLDAHKHESLSEMQVSAAKEALAKAEKVHRDRPDERSVRMLDFCRKNAASIADGNDPYRSSFF